MHHHYRIAMARIRETFGEDSLRIFDGLLAGQAAAALARAHDTSVDAIYKIKQRVKDRLRELVARQLDDEEFAERRA